MIAVHLALEKDKSSTKTEREGFEKAAAVCLRNQERSVRSLKMCVVFLESRISAYKASVPKEVYKYFLDGEFC